MKTESERDAARRDLLEMGIAEDEVEEYIAALENLIETGFDLYFEDLKNSRPTPAGASKE